MFLQSFHDYHVAIYNFVYFNVGKNKELAEDLTQDTYTKAWKYRHAFDENKASLKTWLYSIARNLIRDYFKEYKFCNDEGENIVSEASTYEDLNQGLDLHLAMNKLNTHDHELLTMRFINELEIEEVAQIINKSYTATKTAIHRALNNLKQIINP